MQRFNKFALAVLVALFLATLRSRKRSRRPTVVALLPGPDKTQTRHPANAAADTTTEPARQQDEGGRWFWGSVARLLFNLCIWLVVGGIVRLHEGQWVHDLGKLFDPAPYVAVLVALAVVLLFVLYLGWRKQADRATGLAMIAEEIASLALNAGSVGFAVAFKSASAGLWSFVGMNYALFFLASLAERKRSS